MQQLPWTSDDLVRVVQQGGVRESASKVGFEFDSYHISGDYLDHGGEVLIYICNHQVSMEVIPRLSYYMQRVLVRLAREAQRLAGKVIIIDKDAEYEDCPLPSI